MTKIFVLGCLACLLACNPKYPGFDAMGHFEAEEYTIMSETSGRIISLNYQEGDQITAGDTIAVTDTTAMTLQFAQLKAQIAAMNSKLPGIRAQEKVVDTEIAILITERDRFSKLLSEQAVSGKSLDDIVHQLELATARKATFSSQLNSTHQEMKVLEAQQEILKEQLRKCAIRAAVDGTVLDLIARIGDMSVPGKPILKMADLETIILKAYITGDQLSLVNINQKVGVRIDGPEKTYVSYPGTVFWVADKAEFTPKIIQTKKERVSLVYAIKARVENDGKIKIGMPGELILNHE